MGTVTVLFEEKYVGVEAFEQIYHCYTHVVKRSVRHVLKADHYGQVEDVMQETWLKAFKALRNGKTLPLEVVPRWLNRIATNTAIDALRKQQQIKWIPLSSLEAYQRGEPVSTYEKALIMCLFWLQSTNEGCFEYQVIEGDSIKHAVKQLSPKEYACLWLYECGGFSCREIATMFQISEAAVKMRLQRIRARFKRIFIAASEDQ